MHERFKVLVERMHPLYEKLLESSPITADTLPSDAAMPRRGIYLFSEGDNHLYVGRSNYIRRRYQQHTRLNAGHNQAVFAFLLARRETGRIKASYKSGGNSREGLLLDPEFAKAFTEAKFKIGRMHFRYIEEDDPTRQALLEMYVAVCLDTPNNDFDTH